MTFARLLRLWWLGHLEQGQKRVQSPQTKSIQCQCRRLALLCIRRFHHCIPKRDQVRVGRIIS
ncbi:hypothetical protein D7Y19_05695 [Stenotrophomonas maltophilia]|nr:hypothetical protein [Stenotrophomonas maltophilia]MBA0319935.1 hypothetical protein [Stenotrophomonas maltophilia]